MSAPPYKSRLFTLLNRRSIRLKEQLGRTARRVKNTVALGVQILLYPVYLLVQTARIAGTQLEKAIQQQLSPSSETIPVPIEQFLDAIAEEGIPIVGIATDLDSRRLLLVTAAEDGIAVTDDRFQEKLQKQIATLLANYYYERRRYDRLTRKPLSLPSINSHILLPIGWFWQIFRWEQTGAVAMSINLFGESSLVLRRPPLPSLAENPLPHPILDAIDRRLATLEARSLVSVADGTTTIEPVSPASLEAATDSESLDREVSGAWRWYWLIYEAIDHFFQQSETAIATEADPLSLPETATLVPKVPHTVQQRLQDWLEQQGEDPFTIAKLIRAAIEHFFVPTRPLALTAGDDDPWLDVADLFVATDISPSPSATPSMPSRLPAAVPIPRVSRHEYTKRVLSQEVKPKSLQKIAAAVTSIVPNRSKSKAIVSREASGEILPNLPSIEALETAAVTSIVPNRSKPEAIVSREASGEIGPIHSSIEPQEPFPEDWLETSATPTGYVKHPLERILERLDAIILWVEEWVIKLWRWLKPRRRRSKTQKRRRD